MREFLLAHLPDCLAALILLSRLADIGTTLLATPRLRLESNPLVRRLPRTTAIASLFLCLLPYWAPGPSLVILVPSLLVSASNAAKLWTYRAVGEERAFETALATAARAHVGPTLAVLMLPPLIFAVLAAVLMLFYPDPARDWGYWFALGILTYALALFIYGPLNFFRLRKLAAARASTVG